MTCATCAPRSDRGPPHLRGMTLTTATDRPTRTGDRKEKRHAGRLPAVGPRRPVAGRGGHPLRHDERPLRFVLALRHVLRRQPAGSSSSGPWPSSSGPPGAVLDRRPRRQRPHHRQSGCSPARSASSSGPTPTRPRPSSSSDLLATGAEVAHRHRRGRAAEPGRGGQARAVRGHAAGRRRSRRGRHRPVHALAHPRLHGQPQPRRHRERRRQPRPRRRSGRRPPRRRDRGRSRHERRRARGHGDRGARRPLRPRVQHGQLLPRGRARRPRPARHRWQQPRARDEHRRRRQQPDGPRRGRGGGQHHPPRERHRRRVRRVAGEPRPQPRPAPRPTTPRPAATRARRSGRR